MYFSTFFFFFFSYLFTIIARKAFKRQGPNGRVKWRRRKKEVGSDSVSSVWCEDTPNLNFFFSFVVLWKGRERGGAFCCVNIIIYIYAYVDIMHTSALG